MEGKGEVYSMYLKQQKRANGDIYLSIMEKYYVPKIGAREKTVESLGCISVKTRFRTHQ